VTKFVPFITSEQC